MLLRFGLYQALRLGKPLQFHVGFGDRDCDLHTTNPLYLLDFLRATADTPVMLLLESQQLFRQQVLTI